MSPPGPTLSRMAAASFALHLLVIFLAGGTALFKGRRFITPNPYFVDLVATPAAKRSALPRKPKSEQKNPPVVKTAPPKRKEEPKAAEKTIEPIKPMVEKPGLKPTNKKSMSEPQDISREIERLRAVQRLRRLQDLRDVVDARRVQTAEDTSSSVSSPGEAGDRAHVYYGVVTHRVWEHWTYAGDPRPDWETLVYIRLDDNGTLVDQRVEESSGNEEFDRSVLRALTKAAPFPPPPEGIDRNIVFRFRP